MNQSFEEFKTHFNYHIELIKLKRNFENNKIDENIFHIFPF